MAALLQSTPESRDGATTAKRLELLQPALRQDETPSPPSSPSLLSPSSSPLPALEAAFVLSALGAEPVPQQRDACVRAALQAYNRPVDRLPSGLVYHEAMLEHRDPQSAHPESPERLLAMAQVLERAGLLQRMTRLAFGPASTDDLLRVHSAAHVGEVDALRRSEPEQRGIFASEGTARAAFLAAGGVVRACEAVMSGEVANALCLVRPSGHHAEHARAGGSCFFNSVAVAAAAAVARLGCRRVLVVDWDAHHGNGLQRAFFTSDAVLCVSVHRRLGGRFFPPGPDGGPACTGEGRGAGFTVNVGWNSPGVGDADVLAAWGDVVMPAARAFAPELVIVAAGLDAGAGDPLGGCTVSPGGFSQLTHALTGLAGGRVVLALEGGYALQTLAACALVCAQVLAGAPPLPLGPLEAPSPAALEAIRATLSAHAALNVDFARRWAGRWAPSRPPPLPPTPDEAALFVERVRAQLPPSAVARFNTMMHGYRAGSATMADAIACFEDLFRGRADLLGELNRFLPDDMKLPSHSRAGSDGSDGGNGGSSSSDY